MKKLAQMPLRTLTRWLYLAGAALLVLCLLGRFAADSLLYATGRIYPQTITLADTGLYTLADLAWDGGETLTAQTGDVQLYLQPGQPVRYLRLYADYPGGADYEKDLYWHLPGRGYTPRCRVWPTPGPDGSWDYTVPLLAGQNLRLDLADQSGAQIRVKAIVLNQRPPLADYCIPTLWQLACLAVLPGLLGCAAGLVRDAAARPRHTKKGGSRP